MRLVLIFTLLFTGSLSAQSLDFLSELPEGNKHPQLHETAQVLCQDYYDTTIVQACDSYTWRDTTYYGTGIYQDTSQQADPSCDSIFTLNLIIRPSNNYYYNIDGCDSVVFRGFTYYNGGYVADTLPDQFGCDSIVEYFIYVETLDRTVITNGASATAQQTNVQYQWINCDNGNQMVVGATAQSFDPSMYNEPSGNYAVVIFSINCTATSDCVFLQNIGLRQWSIEPPQVFPNPSQGEVQIQLPTDDTYEFELFDAQGRSLVVMLETQGNLQKLSLPQAAGLYYLRIRNSSDEVWQETIIRK